jgi:hypothetical protein
MNGAAFGCGFPAAPDDDVDVIAELGQHPHQPFDGHVRAKPGRRSEL